MSTDLIIVIGIAGTLSVAAIGYLLFNREARVRRRLRTSRARPIAQLGVAGSRVCVEGKVVCAAPLTAPSGAKCVAFRFSISRPLPRPGAEGSGPRWKQVAFTSDAVPFLIEDASGSLAVVVSTNDDDIETILAERVCHTSQLAAAERKLLEDSDAPVQGELPAKALSVGDDVRVQERAISIGDEIKVVGELRTRPDGELELAGGREPLLLGPARPQGG